VDENFPTKACKQFSCYNIFGNIESLFENNMPFDLLLVFLHDLKSKCLFHEKRISKAPCVRIEAHPAHFGTPRHVRTH